MKNNIFSFGFCFFTGVFLTLLFVGLLIIFPSKIRTDVLSEKEFVGKEFKVRVRVNNERFVFVPGVYYSFETITKLGEVKKITVFRRDDFFPINEESVRFINEEKAYFFIGWKYFVTMDSGNSWLSWNAENQIPKWECCPYGFIEKVDISENGAGIMVATSKDHREKTFYYTCDFGVSWKKETLSCGL